MSQLKTIIQDLINDRSEQAQSTIHQYLVQKMSSLTEAKMSDDGRGHIIGGAKDWLRTIEATPEDLQKAFTAAKKLPSYKALEKTLTDITSAAEAKSGTFAFNKDGGEYKSKYRVYAHGQLRSASQQSNAGYRAYDEPTKATSAQQQYRMKSLQPTVVKGNAYKSILSTYDNAFKELYRTASKTGRIKEDLDQLDEAFNSGWGEDFDQAASNIADLLSAKGVKVTGKDVVIAITGSDKGQTGDTVTSKGADKVNAKLAELGFKEDEPSMRKALKALGVSTSDIKVIFKPI